MTIDNPSNLMPDQEIIIEGDAGFVPKASPSDAGKVLGVLNSSGDVGWVVDQSGTFIQVQADWAETDSSQPSYIDNKPDLSVYATASSVETSLAGKQDNISDLSEIRAGAAKGDTAVQPSALDDYATTSAMNTALAGKQDTISDLATIRSGAAAGATAVQPSALESYATTSAMNTALAEKQDVINDLATIRSGAALGATAAQPGDLPSSDELLPSASSGDAGKVLTVDSQGEPSWQTPASVTVDQTYNASSTNAQSGVAVAQAIAAIPAPSVDEVPDVTSSDDGKILTAAYSGGVGSYSWQPASGGGSSYTAGTAIGINNDAISVLYDGNTMGTMYPTHDYFVFRVSSSGTSLAHFATPDSIKTVLTTGFRLTYPVYSFKVKILDGQLLYFSGNYTSQNCRLCFGTDMSFSSRIYYTSSNLSMTYDSSSNRTYIDAQEITISTIYNQVGYINPGWSSPNWSSSSSPDYFTFILGDEVSPASYVTTTSSSTPYTQFISANGSDKAQLYTKGIRGTTSIYDIAVVDALPEYPINTTLYLIPET